MACGLQPRGGDGRWLHWVPMHGSTPLPEGRLELFGPAGQRALRLGDDYLLVRSGAQTLVPSPAPLVFAGWGIQAPEFDDDDYATIDARGKIVVMLTGEPPSYDPGWFGGPASTAHASIEAKLRTALAHGARGSVLVLNPREEQGRCWAFWQQQYAFEEVGLAYAVSGHLGLLMAPCAAATLFEGAERSLDGVLALEARGALPGFPLPTRLSFHGDFREREFLAPNVLAALPGSDATLADEWVVASAHHDHLGIGPPVNGDGIYNGVADNAMGVACLLELARVLSGDARAGVGPRRSVLLATFTGEEQGLLGSSWYPLHPAVPVGQTVADLNIDGLAMFDTFYEAIGVGAEQSTLGDRLAAVAAPLGLTRWLIYGQQVYHTPADDLGQSIDYAATCQHCGLLAALCRSVANDPERPRWKVAPAVAATRDARTVRVVGSDTMLPLTRAWAAAFMRGHPGVSVQVAGGGSAAGLRRLIAGEADLSALSRPVDPDEARSLAIARERLGMTYLVAKDALSIDGHPDNPVIGLTLTQLRGLFSGRFRRWSDVGGFPLPVVPLIRPPASGTYRYLLQHVLEEQPYARTAVALATTDAPHGTVAQLIDWVLGSEGQRIVRKAGFVSIWEDPAAAPR